MRDFRDLREAGLEIRRDLYKGPEVVSSRVQQFMDLEGLDGHERFGYSYSIHQDGFPGNVHQLLKLGEELNFSDYQEEEGRKQMFEWLVKESIERTTNRPLTGPRGMTEKDHPHLISTLEGQWPSYRYSERLRGSIDILAIQLLRAPDTRRAYWPIFWQNDVYRAHAPTRVPCSLGYQFLIRRVNNDNVLLMLYYQRSADFEHFWLSDVWFAQQFQLALRSRIIKQADGLSTLNSLKMGAFIHFVASFHLFGDKLEEIY